MTPARAVAALLAATLAGGLLTGCGRVDDALEVASGTADLGSLYPEPSPALEPVLTAPGDSLQGGDSLLPGPVEVASDGEVTVVVRDEQLTAYDSSSREVLWRTRVPEVVCGTSGMVNGHLALLADDAPGFADCGQVWLVDATDGEVRWRRDLGDALGVRRPGVALTPATVYAAGACSEVRRFDVGDGDVLPPLGDTGDCGTSWALDDTALASARALEGGRTGFTLDVEDAVTGRRLARDTFVPDDGRVGTVLTTDPLVVQVSDGPYNALHRYDDRGRPAGYLGRALGPYSDREEVRAVARLDDVLVLAHEDLPGYTAYDLGTGEELWATDDDRLLAGSDGRDLVWTQPVQVVGDDGTATPQQQVTRTSAADPGEGELLGALTGTAQVTAVSGADLLVDDGSGVDVVPLPAQARGAAPAPGPSVLDGFVVDDPALADGDVLPSEVDDPCPAIGADTLTALGLRAEVPAPATCRWLDYTSLRPGEVSLDVAARAVRPGELPAGQSLIDPDPGVEEAAATATGAATQIFSRETRRWDDLDGPGDEARGVSRTNRRGTISTARIRVRSGNVIVEVDASTSGPVGPAGRPVPVDVLEEAVRDAAEDVLDATLV